MRCAACGGENRESARFCQDCGARQDLRCRSCGNGLRAGARFCDQCGESQVAELGPQAPASPASGKGALATETAERRQLTLMFCDLVGSTELSQQLDAEALREVLRTYQQCAAGVIERYQGHIAQYLGDGLLVYFGYPLAHEDDAERAVRAGFEVPVALAGVNERLESRHGIRLQARIGIHTGPVVVSEVGGGERRETLALGATTNIAARLEGLAEPDSVVISHDTLSLVPGLFITRDLGTPLLKGVSAPIRAYRVVQPSGVRGRLAAADRLTPFVGRKQEIGLLADRWQQVRAGEGEAVFIAGEPGVGKSRLVKSLGERLAGEPHTWLECGCSDLTRHSAFLPLVELVAEGLGFQRHDTPEERLDRLEHRLEQLGLPVVQIAPLLAQMLSLPDDRYPPSGLGAGLRRRRLLESLWAWIQSLAKQQPLVLVVEDLQWCDPSTLDVLGLLLDKSRTERILLILTFRPEFEPPWPARVGTEALSLSLERLRGRKARAMVARICAGRRLPAFVVERIVQRSDGIPLYVEELTKMVLETDALSRREGSVELSGELAVPASLQDSLMARLDRLSAAKTVAQLGAVLGREFSYSLLEAVSPLGRDALLSGLARLVDAEMLFRRADGTEVTYTFRHALIQDTAYQSLLKSSRRELHALAAAALDERFPELAAARPEVVARHFEIAGRVARAAAWYRRAGSSAAERSANAEAIRLFTCGIDLLAAMPETSERQRLELALQTPLAGSLAIEKGWACREVAAAAMRARELGQELGGGPEHDQALLWLSMHHWLRAHLDLNIRLLEDRLRLEEPARTPKAGRGSPAASARPLGDDAYVRLSAMVGLGVARYFRGELSRAHRHLKDAISYFRSIGDDIAPLTNHPDPRTQALIYDGLVLLILGFPEAALARSEESVELAHSLDHPLSVAATRALCAQLHLMLGQHDRARSYAAAAMELSRERGFPFYLGFAQFLFGSAHAGAPEPAIGLAHCQEGRILLRPMKIRVGVPHSGALLAELLCAVDRPDDAASALKTAFAAAEDTGQHHWNAELHRLRAEVLFRRRDPAAAEVELARALSSARAQEARWFELRAGTRLARALGAKDAWEDAEALLSPIYDRFTEGFETPDLQAAGALLEEARSRLQNRGRELAARG